MHPDGYPNRTGRPNSAPRCGAHARTTGRPCQAPAIRGAARCRMHGGKGSGAPMGNRNAVTTDRYSAAAHAHAFWMAWLFHAISGDRRHLRHVLSTPAELFALAKRLRAFAGIDEDDQLAADVEREAMALATHCERERAANQRRKRKRL